MNEQIAKIEGIESAIRAGANFGFEAAYSFAIDMARMIIRTAKTNADRETATLMFDFLSSQRDEAKTEFLTCLRMDQIYRQ